MGLLDDLFEVPRGQLPVDNGTAVLVLSLLYPVAMVVVTWARPKAEQKLKWASFVHNCILSLFSLYVFLGFGRVLLDNFLKSQDSVLTVLTCDTTHSLWTGTDYWYYIFVLSKIYEWLDTVVLILRGKAVVPPSTPQYALHLFHHTTVLSIAWLSWRYPIGASWTGPLTNAFVHFFMYGYYALTDFGLPRQLGLLITPMQLAQFYFCLAFAVKDLVMVLLWGPQSCNINVYTLSWVGACYVVFLVMFIGMYATKKTQLGTPRGGLQTSKKAQ